MLSVSLWRPLGVTKDLRKLTEAVWSDLQPAKYLSSADCYHPEIINFAAVTMVRQQRALLHRIDHRVGQLEERLNIAFVHTADQADALVELKTTIRRHHSYCHGCPPSIGIERERQGPNNLHAQIPPSNNPALRLETWQDPSIRLTAERFDMKLGCLATCGVT